MEKTAIDLLWLRPGQVGGTESYIRNLLDGLLRLDEDFAFTLLVSKDNIDTFRKYEADSRFTLLLADVESSHIAGRILWQNFCQNRMLKKHGIRRCFEPVYCKPWLNGGVDYICVIHDLQAYHYPEYHPLHEVAYSKLCWRMDMWNASGIVTISNWVKEDIIKKYKRKDIRVIYNPVLVRKEEVVDFKGLQEKYGIERKQFFYTVSQMIPHKNLKTLICLMDQIVRNKKEFPQKLLISGVNGNAAEELIQLMKEKNLEENIILTGFVSNEERNTLYKECHSFLFPSVFEGFGMPPVEAMLFGTKVVTTKCTSIPEITQGKALYVEDPFCVEEWMEKLSCDAYQCGNMDFSVFDSEAIAKQYLELLKESVWKKK